MFQFHDLNDVTRKRMLDEAVRDSLKATEYFGKRLSPKGVEDWPLLFRDAIQTGSPESLAAALQQFGRLKTVEISHRKGVPYQKSVPSNAAQLLAEGEFNRCYCRALCLRAIAENKRLEVYRGRHSDNPRAESLEWEGKDIDPQLLLDDLRLNTGGEPDMRVPSVNSGLSVRLRDK